MFSRFGLRFRMAASYVVFSAAAVLVVEAVTLTILLPLLHSTRDTVNEARQTVAQAEISKVQTKAKAFSVEDAAALAAAATRQLRAKPKQTDAQLLAAAVTENGFGLSSTANQGGAVARTPNEVSEVLATVAGKVVASSPRGSFAVGSWLPVEASQITARTGTTQVKGQLAGWSTSPVTLTASSSAQPRVIGIAYARVTLQGGSLSGLSSTSQGVTTLLVVGLIVLVLVVPLGALFGLASTGPLIRRIQGLAVATTAIADGDLAARIPVSGGDEVAVLESGFNAMAEQLEAAVKADRERAGAEARRDERTRIARDLHDSISQDLFSVSLLAGGLRRALSEEPGGDGRADLGHQAESMERTLERTMLEMRAMMLELRPVALEDVGLAAALEGLCQSYGVRLGIQITAEVGVLRLRPQVEQAVLRVVQEALGNAVRHGRPGAITLRVNEVDGQVAVLVSDDGRGFDELRVGERRGMGLELMRERVTELGGTFEVASAPEQGTTVHALIPGGAA